MIHAMGSPGKLLAAVSLGVGLLTLPALAAPPKKGKGTKVEKLNLDLGLGALGGALPKADGIEARRAQNEVTSPKVTTSDVRYTVLKVEHAWEFTRTAEGARPVGAPLTEIGLYGRPPSTPKFTTLVRVKATQNVNAPIELVILDPRGDTAMEGRGELSFTGSRRGEVDWLIDWAPTARPDGGEYTLLVRIAGRPMGTWPLKVVAAKN